MFFRKKKSQESEEQDKLPHLLDTFRERTHRYSPMYVLGEGGYGKVLCCFDEHLNRAAALKSLRDEFDDDPKRLQALVQEARLMGYLDHPGIVSVYDTTIDHQGRFSYAMKMIEGVELNELLRELFDADQLMPLSQCLLIFTKICESLAYVHNKGVIHLDIKPHNIMVGSYGEVYLVDWGTARLFHPESYAAYLSDFGKDEKASQLEPEQEHRLVGSPPYMSPEQSELSHHELTPSSDIFSAGVLLYYMISGEFPFPIKTLESYFYALHHKEPVPLHYQRSDVPKKLSQICACMLEKNASQRYTSFRDVLHDLQDLTETGKTFEVRILEPGTEIFREGEPGDCAFQIIDGSVEISALVDGQKRVLATRRKGSIVGELAVFTEEPRTATVTAIERTVVKMMTQEDIHAEMDKLAPWVGQMVFSLSHKFIELNQQLIDQSVPDDS